MWIGHQTRLRAEAAAMLWKKHPKALVICSGGRSAPLSPSEAESMQDFMTNAPWNIPRECIITENESAETAENIRNVVSVLRTKGMTPNTVILIAGRRHIRRACRYLKAYGIYAEGHTAYHVLGISPEDVALRDQVHEIILSLLQIIDTKGFIPTWIKRHWKKV